MARNPNVYGGVCVWFLIARRAELRRLRRQQVANIDGDAMLAAIDSHVRGYSFEIREELRQEIALAIVAHAWVDDRIVAVDTLTPAIVREIARSLYKQQPNRFRDISLDHCYDDGTRLEERLAG